MTFAAWNATVETIYAAASAPSRWPEALEAVAVLLDARGALLLYQHGDGRYGGIVSPALLAVHLEYSQHWQQLDVRAERVVRAIAEGHRDVQADHTFFTEAEAAALPIYRDFLHPRGFGWGMTASVSPMPAVQVILTLVRAHGRPGFDEEAQGQLLALSRHVERALSLAIRLMDAEAERLGLAGALDRIACGAFVLDAGRQVLFANATARSLLGGGLAIEGGRLKVRDAAARATFEARLAEIGQGAHPAFVVPDGERGLLLTLLPLQEPPDAPALQSGTAILLVQAPGGARPFDPALVRDMFKLTLGEARVAALVGAGAPPGEAAASLGIAEQTARTVLKRVFEKVGVSRQSELAALLGQLFLLREPR